MCYITVKSPHFECPKYLESIKCTHHFIKTSHTFILTADKFFADTLGMYEGFRNFDLYFTKTKVQCALCGLGNTIYHYNF